MLDAKHMPKGPKGQRRAADAIGNDVRVMKVVTGEVVEAPQERKNQGAAELGRRGGKARAEKLSTARRREIAKQAARARWR